MTKTIWTGTAIAAAFVAGFLARDLAPGGTVAHAQAPRVFELRTYTAPDGKLDNLHARFRSHTTRLFQKHGMTNIGYFRPADAPLAQNTLVYVLAYPSREAAKASWDAFRADPEWQKVVEESQRNGPIVANVQSVFMTAADYSPLK
jgi:NIPSNAP